MSSLTRRCRWPATLFAAILTMICLLTANHGAAATFTLQAEDGEVVRGLSASNRSGFIGTGFVDLVNEPGSYVEWVIDMSDAAVASTLAFRFANGATTHRKLKILVNGASALPGNLICPPTGSWSTWRTKTVTGVTLRKGLNSIRVEFVTATAAPNLDQVVVTTEAQLTLLDWARAIIHSTIDVRYPDPALLGAADSGARTGATSTGYFCWGCIAPTSAPVMPVCSHSSKGGWTFERTRPQVAFCPKRPRIQGSRPGYHYAGARGAPARWRIRRPHGCLPLSADRRPALECPGNPQAHARSYLLAQQLRQEHGSARRSLHGAAICD